MSAFDTAIEALFADAHLACDVVYRAGGAGTPVTVRAIIARPDAVDGFGETRAVMATGRVDVRVSQIASPAAGDTIAIGGIVHTVQGVPIRDIERLVWRLEARP
jgi:hypothetical protein